MTVTKPQRLTLLLILLATFAIYAPSFGNSFAMDDRIVAMSHFDGGPPNEMIAELQPVGTYFGTLYWHKNEIGADPLYRPLTILSYALTYRFLSGKSGDELSEALPHHVINVLLHLLCVWLVYRMLLLLTARPWPALLGAAAFAAHSIHSEVVSAIVGRAELLSMCFGASATLVFARAFSCGWARAIPLYIGVAVLFALACFSKESGLTWAAFLPVFVIARHFFEEGAGDVPLRPLVLRSVAIAAAVVTVPVALFFIFRQPLQPDTIYIDYMANPLWHSTWLVRLLTAIKVWGYGLLLTILPVHQAVDYGASHFELVNSFDGSTALALVALLAVLAGGLLALRRNPLLFLAATTFLGFSFVTSNVPFAIGTIFGERLYYVPSMAMSFLFAWLALQLRETEFRRAAVAVGAALWLGFNAKGVLARHHIWQNDEVLFRHAVLESPRVVRMHLNRAATHERLREYTAALNHYDIARAIEPEISLSWNNTGAILLDTGRLEEAEEAVKRGLETRYQHPRADGYKLWANLGLIHVAMGKRKEAISDFANCLAIRPEFMRTRHDLLRVAIQELPPEECEKILAEGEKHNPGEPIWQVHRGYIAHKREQWVEAQRLLRAALLDGSAFPPQSIGRPHHAQMVLADCLVQLGEEGKKEAIVIYEGIAGDERAPMNIRDAAQGLLNRFRAEARPGDAKDEDK